MPKLKSLAGRDVVRILGLFGFVVVAQKGSHIKLVRTVDNDMRQTLTLPNHPDLDKGTLKAIYRQASRYILKDQLSSHFYTKEK